MLSQFNCSLLVCNSYFLINDSIELYSMRTHPPSSLYKTNATECLMPADAGSEDIRQGCDSCRNKVSEQFSYAVKVSGAVGLFFSFTEVRFF